jgi:hypothetical protein
LSGPKNPELAMPGELEQFRDLVLQVAHWSRVFEWRANDGEQKSVKLSKLLHIAFESHPALKHLSACVLRSQSLREWVKLYGFKCGTQAVDTRRFEWPMTQFHTEHLKAKLS